MRSVLDLGIRVDRCNRKCENKIGTLNNNSLKCNYNQKMAKV